MKRFLVFLFVVSSLYAQAPRPPITPASPAARGQDKEVWLAIRTDNHPGAGTAEDPFDCKTTKFDTKMASFGPYTTIHLAPGTFQTNPFTRTWHIKTGWVFAGAGQEKTTIQATGTSVTATYVSVLGDDSYIATADGVQVNNLTVDGNGIAVTSSMPTISTEKHGKVNLIRIFGSNNIIDHVHGVHQYGSNANGDESFGIGLLAAPTGSSGGVISYCRVDSPDGNYGTPYFTHGYDTTHLLANASVDHCTATGVDNGLNGKFNSGGVNTANVKNISITNCVFTDCLGIQYHDTGVLDGLRIDNCECYRAGQGVTSVAVGTIQRNIDVSHCRMEIQCRNDIGRSWGVLLGDGSVTITGCHVWNNTIIKVSGGSGVNEVAGVALFDGFVHNSIIADNTIDATYNFALPASGNIYRNNLHSDGTGITDVSDSNTSINKVDALVAGALRVEATQTVTGAGAIIYQWTHDVVIASGDKLQYEVLCDSSSPAVYAFTELRNGMGVQITNDLTVDQNGLASISKLDLFAKDQWYLRTFSLTPFAGQTAATMNTGFLPVTIGPVNNPSGTYRFYLRHVRIINSSGNIKYAYYDDESKAAPTVGSSAGFTSASVTANFGGTISATPASIALAIDPFDGTTDKFLNAAGRFVTTGVGTGDVVGPGSSTAHHQVSFADTTGKLLEDGGKSINHSGDTLAVGYVPTMNSSTPGDWAFAAVPGSGGGGTVTSVSLGNLSPIFTASVATATTTAAGTFTLTTAAAHRFLGNNTGSTAAPAYSQINVADVNGLAASATTDTTVATNITSGTLPAARLPTPTSSTLGGVQSHAAVVHEWLRSISTSGVPTASRPDVTDIASAGSALIKADGLGSLTAAGAGIDYVAGKQITPYAFSSPLTAIIAPGDATTLYNVGTLTGDLTVNASSGTPIDGQSLKFRFIQNSVGGHVITWNSVFAFGTDITTAMFPIAANAKFEVAFQWNDTDGKWRCVGLIRGF